MWMDGGTMITDTEMPKKSGKLNREGRKGVGMTLPQYTFGCKGKNYKIQWKMNTRRNTTLSIFRIIKVNEANPPSTHKGIPTKCSTQLRGGGRGRERERGKGGQGGQGRMERRKKARGGKKKRREERTGEGSGGRGGEGKGSAVTDFTCLQAAAMPVSHAHFLHRPHELLLWESIFLDVLMLGLTLLCALSLYQLEFSKGTEQTK